MSNLLEIVNDLDNLTLDLYQLKLNIKDVQEKLKAKEKKGNKNIRDLKDQLNELRKNEKELKERFKEKVKNGFYEVENLEINQENILEVSKIIGAYLSMNIKTTQIRKLLDAIRRLQTEINKSIKDKDKNQKESSVSPKERKNLKLELLMLKPKIAYTAARHEQLKPFIKFIDPFINEVINKSSSDSIDKEAFQKLVYFIESIVAYHRFYGGQD